MAVADSVSGLAAAAQRFLSSGMAPSWVVIQFEAGCYALAACGLLARLAEQLQAASMFKIAAACGLVFGPGTLQLGMLLRTVGPATDPAVTEDLRAACKAQLTAADQCINLTRQATAPPTLAAAFARSTGKPAALLPWLLAAARALAAVDCYSPGEQGEFALQTYLMDRMRG